MTEQEEKEVMEILRRMDEDEYWNPSHLVDYYALKKRIEIDRFIKALDNLNSDLS